MKFMIEYTDTFAGDANYSWVRRAEFEAPETITDTALMRRAKKALGLSGVRGVRETWGETLVLRPYGLGTILFISPEY
jgi:hypothetical protein